MQLLDRLQHDIGDLAYAIATVRPDAADVQVREIVIVPLSFAVIPTFGGAV